TSSGLLKAYEELHFEANKQTKSKKFFKDLQYLKRDILYKIQLTDQSLFYINGLLQNLDPDLLVQEAQKLFSFQDFIRETKSTEDSTGNSEKLTTHEVSYRMFTEGKSIADIAKERNLVQTTIESHLLKYVATGLLKTDIFIAK